MFVIGQNIVVSTKIDLTEPYAPRPIRFLELWEPSGWRVKVYGIAYRSPEPRSQLLSAAKDVALHQFTRAAVRHAHYGVGFLIVHDGRGANFVLVDWWANENELHSHAYISPSDDPGSLVYAAPTGPIACTWDLVVVAHERQAWVDTILTNPAGPDVDAYLAARLEGEF